MNGDSATRWSAALLRGLLATTALGFAAALVAGIGWYRSAHRPSRLESLQPSERQALFAEMETATPGLFEPAWFEPRIGFTLKRSQRLEAWGDTFRSNELGYRTGALKKRPGVFRIVLLGDSWTYGMGVREAESFPEVLEQLAPAGGEGARRVECWTLALPGYNLLNSLAAFELWETALAADAVVIVPSSNDNESSLQVLPNGQLSAGNAASEDAFGEPHAVSRPFPWLFDGHRSLVRWQIAFDRIRALELHLKERGTPLALFFVARWNPAIVHKFVAGSQIEAGYAVVPVALTLDEWLTPPPTLHGNPRANQVYGRILHRLLERTLGWPSLEDQEPLADAAPLFDRVPPEEQWKGIAADALREATRRFVPERFEAGPDSANAWAGPGDPATGAIGLATTLLVHPPAGTTSLEVRVRRLDEVSEIYPLGLEVSILSPSGGTTIRTAIPADGAGDHLFRIAVPRDRDGDQALEVVFVADRVSSVGKSLVPRSLAIESIEPVR